MKTVVDILHLKPFAETLPQEDLVSRQRLRLFKVATAMSLFVCVGFAFQVLTILPEPTLVGLMLLLFCLVFFNFFALLVHKKSSISYAILLISWFILVHTNAYYSGGIKNSGNFYLSTVVLSAFILLGSRGGKIMAGLSIAHLIYFYFLTEYTDWVTYEFVGKGETLLNLYFLLSTAVSLLMLTAASSYIENSKNAVIRSLYIKNEELSEASGKLQLSTHAAQIGLWSWDLEKDSISWDDTMYTLYGIKAGTKISYNDWQNMLHDSDKDMMERELELRTKQGQQYEVEYRIILPGGAIRHIKAAARVDMDGNGRAMRIVGANWDITERKKAEEAIIDSNKRYELATKATSNSIWDWNLTNGDHFWSKAYQQSFGYLKNEQGEDFETYASRIHPDDAERVKRGLFEVINGKKGDYWEDEYRFLKSDGTYAFVYDRGNLVFDEDNQPVRFVGAMQDITTRKNVEAEREMIIDELMRSNANLKQFSYITSHNLRAPLSNISAILGLIDQSSFDANNKEMFKMLELSGKQLVSTIDDLTKILLIKNDRKAEVCPLNIAGALQEIKNSFSSALLEIKGSIQTDFKVPVVAFHKVYLDSLFVNLISNSIKYRSPDRNLSIHISTCLDHNGNCILTFSDNGIGIDVKRYKDRVFGLYQRFHPKLEGQGLGLFMVKSQIEALGGEITLQSEVDQGATFTIKFKKLAPEMKTRKEILKVA